MTVGNKPKTSHCGVMITTFLVIFAIGFAGKVPGARTNEDSEQPKDQLLALIADAITDSLIGIAYCKIPEVARPSALENGVVPEMLENYSAASVALSLTKVSVVGKLRGDMDSVIFLRNVAWFREKVFFTPFRYQPGSGWVVFLENPFSTRYPDHDVLMKKYEATNAGTFLSPRNFYSVYDRGFGAVCVEWPEAAENRPSVVATLGFVEDLKLIVKRFEDFSNSDKDLEPEEKFLPKLQDEYGRLLYRKVFNAE